MTTAIIIALTVLALAESVHFHINLPPHWSTRA
jgi:hypothetical protein